MRLAFVLSSLTLSGGVLLVIDYANRLAARGHALAVVYPKGAADPALAAALHPSVQQVQAGLSLEQGRTLFGKLRLSSSLARAIPAADAVIATHTPTTLPVLLATTAPRVLRPRRAWLYMDYDEMFAERPAERLLLHRGPAWFDLVMTISQPLAAAAQKDGAKNVVVTGAGLARGDLFRQSPPRPDAASRGRIFYLGDDRPRKGLAEVLDAVRQLLPELPGLQLVVASKRPLALPPDLPCELHISPTDEQLAALYRSSQLFVSASWGEGLGYPPLEAMACGVPTVIADSVGVRDYARHEVNCLLTPPRDVSALAAAMRRVLGDPTLAARLVQAGKATAATYRWDAVIDRCETALLPLLPRT